MRRELANPRRSSRVVQGCAGVVLIGLAVWAAWFFTSGRFNGYVRGRLVSYLEETTGGRVELRGLKWNLSKLEFELTDLTIHGLEKEDELPPYAHVDRLFVRAKILSIFQREVALRQLTLERPVVHIIVYPDGTTNQPKPRGTRANGRDPIQSLFDLAIERAEVSDGLLIWNEKRIPFDFAANDVSAEMKYAVADKRYDGRLQLGKIDSALQGYRRFASHAEVEFSLFASHAQVKSLQWRSGRSHIQASGAVTDFNDPKLTLTYHGTVDLGEAAAIARLRELRGGILDVSGEAYYAAAGFASSGKLSVRGAEYRAGTAAVRNASATAGFSITPEQLTISKLDGRVAGGTVQGELTINHWLRRATASPSAGPNATARERQGRGSFHLQGVSISEIANALSTSKLPLQRLNAVGTIAGNVTVEWQRSLRELRASLDVTSTPPANASADQVPVEAVFRGNYRARGEMLEIGEFHGRTREAQITASGTLGSTSGNVKLTVDAKSISEFRPLLEAIRGPEPLPVDVGGALSFTGTATGRFSQPTIQGYLELRDFVTSIPKRLAKSDAPATTAEQQKVHWDSLAGDVLYSPERVSIGRGVLRRGAAQINMDASSALNKGKFEQTLPFAGRVNVRNVDAAELQSILGYAYPVRGTLEANLQFGGTMNDPRANGHFRLRDANLYEQPVRALEADFGLLRQELQLRNIVALSDSGELRGGGSYNYGSEAFTFTARGNNFKLSGFRQLQTKRVRLDGIANFDAQGSGKLSEPVINAKLRVTNVLLNGERIGDLTADATTHGADLKLTALSSYQNAALKIDGTVRLRGDLPAQIGMTFGELDLNPLLKSYFPGRMTGHTTIAGMMRLNGPLRQPKELNGELNVDRFLANVENVAIHNDGAIRVVMAHEQVRIERFRLVGEGTHFIEASGTAQLAGSQRLNLRVAGKVNLELMQTFSPDVLAHGTSDFGLDVVGTWSRPQLNGRVLISDGAVSYTDLPNGLSGINGSLIFTQDRLQVESLTARTGGGELVLGGFITYDRALTFNLTARGHDIRLRYPPGISATADANLTLAGTPKNSLLSGEITVTKFGVNPRFDFALYLARSKQTPQVPTADSPLNGLKFDVHVVSTPELEVQTSLAKVSGDVDLRLRGTAARPAVLGRVNIVEGDVSFNGTQYHLERGDITFTNPVRIEPILDLEATARVRDYDITLGFHGSIDKLSTTYRSDPPLPTGDIIALLALGRTREESVVQSMNSQQYTTTLTESASNALLGQALNATVSSRVQKLFGVSRIKIDPQVGGPENNPNARLTIEQGVSNKITLTYITNLSQSAQQVIQVEYNINKNVSILAVRDQNGVVGFDVRVRQRKK